MEQRSPQSGICLLPSNHKVLQAMMMVADKIHSVPNENPAYVCFLNLTERDVKIIWLDFNGVRVIYTVLKKNEFVQVNTFEKHPWIFEDKETGDRMLADQQEVFYPVPFQKAPGRKIIRITYPLYSLRERALQIVRNCIVDQGPIRLMNLKTGKLQSKINKEQVYVCFKNNTTQEVNVIWLDFDGSRVLYSILRRDEILELNTYVHHPWIFEINKTGDRLLANNQQVFYARASPEPVDASVNIMCPFYTLQERALHVIRNCIYREEDVEQLELPYNLQQDLKKMIIRRKVF